MQSIVDVLNAQFQGKNLTIYNSPDSPFPLNCSKNIHINVRFFIALDNEREHLFITSETYPYYKVTFKEKFIIFEGTIDDIQGLEEY